ncbi:MAG: hypothetical protein Q4F27_06970 [Desulfovibrionaceae bacterium]|nr:hypothetical protein [Desulfovibrionaceae bacterium]
MSSYSSLQYVTDTEGHIQAVQIPWEVWQKIEPRASALLSSAAGRDTLPPEPLADFEDFLKYWDFRYPYSPAVSCPHCGTACEDWRNAPEHPFHLTNANLGGLLVFRCKACGCTIRQKHFRDHVAHEHTGPA